MEQPWEDYLLERKVESDLKDLRKTLVASANSVKPGHVATILIGERDDGTASGCTSPDKIQKTVRKEAEKIYPPIIWRSTVYQKHDKACVRVEVEYSGDTPHFGGIAWVRKGSTTVQASEEVFQTLIELRLDKVQELCKWLDRDVTIHGDQGSVPPPRELGSLFSHRTRTFTHRWAWEEVAKIILVNRFWVTFQDKEGNKKSEPLDKLILTYDDKNDRLKIIVTY
jgi:Putative DNA-binding domain